MPIARLIEGPEAQQKIVQKFPVQRKKQVENSSYVRLIHANVNLNVKGSVEEAPLGNISGPLCSSVH